jgi:hypothetical protein
MPDLQQSQRQHKARVNAVESPSTHHVTEGAPPDVSPLEMAIFTPNEQTLSPSVVRQLQRMHGNQFVQRLIQRSEQAAAPQTAPKSQWNSPENNLFALEYADFPAFESDGDFEADNGELMIQRAWDDMLLDYVDIDKDKKAGKFRTGKAKWNSIEDWVVKFRKAVFANKKTAALKALIGLHERLTSDQKDVAKGNVKPPKGVKSKSVDLLGLQSTALNFYQKWLAATQAHIDHTATNNWLSDFRSVYAPKPIVMVDNSSEEESGEGSSSNDGAINIVNDNRSPREIFLANAAELEHMTRDQLEGMALLWDTGDQGLRQRITAVLGSTDPSVKMVGSLEYFLEAINLEHVGYDKAIWVYDNWLTAVNYYNINATFDEWVEKKKDSIEIQGGRVQHFDPITREQYRLKPTGKNILTAQDDPLIGDNIYVVTSDDKWYGGGKDRKGTGAGAVHHSSFMGGQPVKCAGHLKTDNSGKLLSIDDNSGHYAPNKANLKRAAATLSVQMDVSEVTISSYTGKGAVPLTEFLQMK